VPEVRPLPQDHDLEREILGSCMMQPEAESALLSRVDVTDFAIDAHRVVAKTLQVMSGNGEPLDPTAVVSRLRERKLLERVGGARYVAEVLGATPAVAPSRMGRYLFRLRDLAKRRALIAVARDLEAEAYQDDVDATATDVADGAQSKIQRIVGRGSKDTFHHLRESVRELFVQIEAEEKARQEDKLARPSTGLVDLDKVIGGLFRGQLVIVAARPSMGKTALALNMASAVSRASTKPRQAVHVISAETTHTRIAGRVVATEARMEAGKVMRGALQRQQWSDLTVTAQWAQGLPISVDDRSAPTLQQIRASIRRAQAEHRRVDESGNVTQELGVVFVDYLQLASNPIKGGNREQEVGAIAYGLHAMAKDFDVALVALSQLNRGVESRQDKRPQLSDLRESGNIEQAADVILGLYREEYYNPDEPLAAGLAEVLVLKAKEGARGAVKVKFTPQWMRFANLAKDEDE